MNRYCKNIFFSELLTFNLEILNIFLIKKHGIGIHLASLRGALHFNQQNLIDFQLMNTKVFFPES